MSPITRRWLIAAMVPVNVVGVLSWFGVYTFVNAYVVRGLGHSDVTWTGLTLAYAAGLIFWLIMCSQLSARFGRIVTIRLGLFVGAICFAAMAMVQHVALLAVLLFMTALATAMLDGAWFPMVAEAGGAKPGRAIATNMIIMNVVTAVLLVALGPLVDAARYELTFLLMAGLCAAAAIAFIPISRHLHATQADPVLAVLHLSRADIGTLARGPFLVLIVVAILVEPFNFHTVNQLLPNLARNVHDLREQSISQIVGLGRLPALLSLTLVAMVIDRSNVRRVYGALLVTVALVIVAMGRAESHATLTACYLTYFFFHGAVWATTGTAINSTVTARHRDAAFAITGIVMMVGQFLAGLLHNRLLAAGFDLPQVFTISPAVTAIGGLCIFIYTFTRHGRMKPQ